MSLRGHLLRFAHAPFPIPQLQTLIFANLNAKQQLSCIRTPAGRWLGGRGWQVRAAVDNGSTQLSFKLAKLNENSGNIEIDAKLIQLVLLPAVALD